MEKTDQPELEASKGATDLEKAPSSDIEYGAVDETDEVKRARELQQTTGILRKLKMGEEWFVDPDSTTML